MLWQNGPNGGGKTKSKNLLLGESIGNLDKTDTSLLFKVGPEQHLLTGMHSFKSPKELYNDDTYAVTPPNAHGMNIKNKERSFTDNKRKDQS